jgi:hypothetical protein
MKSGLYDFEGISATARAAAWANWFDEPTTKLSNVYLGLRGEESRSAGADRGGTGLLGDLLEGDPERRLAGLRQGLLEDPEVVLAQPLPELGVRHPDAERGAVQGEVGRRAEPRSEAVAVDLALDPCQASSQSVSDIDPVPLWQIPWRRDNIS